MKSKLQIENWRLKGWVLGSIILCTAGLIFILNELAQNRTYFLRYYEQEQNSRVNQLSYFFEDMLETGNSEEQVITYIQERIESSGSQYPIFVREGEILFVKDENTTRKIERDKQYSKYLQEIQQEFINTSADFLVNGKHYTLAIVTHKNSLVNNWKVTKHEIYTIVVYVVTILSLLAISIIATEIISMKNKTIQSYKNKWIVQNKKLEVALDELHEARVQKLSEDANTEAKVVGKFYDLDIINSLLRKSDRKELRPFYMMIIKLELEDLYYSKQRIFDMMQPIQDLMRSNCIMAEAGKGEFAILMYKTSKSAVEELKKTIYEQGMFRIREEGIKVRLGYIKVKEQSNALDVFQLLHDKIREVEV